MEKSEIIGKVDLTLLSQTATEEQIVALCEKAAALGTASVCVPPCYVRTASRILNGRIKVCTVIGFPTGYNTTAVKCAETDDAIKNGADEIDMVINIGYLKDKKYDLILDEIKQIKAVCGERILKVIIETCLLDEAEKIKMCEVVSLSGADFIKTSTGFSKAGATAQDIALMRKHCAPTVKIKAAGGIRSFTSAEEMIKNGADRIGTSNLAE
jgi:deoxyribose-phosphate aldolase